MYNFCIGVGLALSMLFLQYYPPFKAKTEQEKYKIHLALVISIVLGFLGAYLFDAYSHHLTLTNDHLTRIGFTFLGGLLSGLGILLFILRIYSIPILPTLNLLTIPFCIAHALGRVGCFMAGCCFGRPTDSVLGVVFPKSSLPYEYYHGLVKIHPTQLYESGFVLLLGLWLTKYTKHKFYLYMLGYAIFRFWVEFVRADDRGTLFDVKLVSPSQMLSLAIVILVALSWVFTCVNQNAQKR